LNSPLWCNFSGGPAQTATRLSEGFAVQEKIARTVLDADRVACFLHPSSQQPVRHVPNRYAGLDMHRLKGAVLARRTPVGDIAVDPLQTYFSKFSGLVSALG
jgi:hypothetical protein